MHTAYRHQHQHHNHNHKSVQSDTHLPTPPILASPYHLGIYSALHIHSNFTITISLSLSPLPSHQIITFRSFPLILSSSHPLSSFHIFLPNPTTQPPFRPQAKNPSHQPSNQFNSLNTNLQQSNTSPTIILLSRPSHPFIHSSAHPLIPHLQHYFHESDFFVRTPPTPHQFAWE